MAALFEAVLKHVPPPAADAAKPLQLQISTLDYNSYVGRIGIGRIRGGSVKPGQNVVLRFGRRGSRPREDRPGAELHGTSGEHPLTRATAGDIVAITGIEDVNIGLTLCAPEAPAGLPPIRVDEPTLAMNFQVNSSPLAGRRGAKYVTMPPDTRAGSIGELQSNVCSSGGRHRRARDHARIGTRGVTPDDPDRETCGARVTSWPCRARRC